MPILSATEADASRYLDVIAGRRCVDCERYLSIGAVQYARGPGTGRRRCLACREIANYPGKQFLGSRPGARSGDRWVEMFRGVRVIVRALEDERDGRPRVEIEQAMPRKDLPTWSYNVPCATPADLAQAERVALDAGLVIFSCEHDDAADNGWLEVYGHPVDLAAFEKAQPDARRDTNRYTEA